MKPIARLLAFGSAIAFTPHAGAATVTKAATGTNLNDGASWGGTAPGASDIATWTSTSLGAGLTMNGDAAWQGIKVNGAASALGIAGAGTLTLGAAGFDLGAATVDCSIATPIALAAPQTWQVRAGRVLVASGQISGSEGISVGVIPDSATSTTFLTLAAQTLFPNLTLASVVSVAGKLGGAYVNGGVPKDATGYHLVNNGTTATCQLQVSDGGYIKCVKIELTQVGPDVAARAVDARYITTGTGGLGYNFDTQPYNQGTVATSQAAGGYGVNTTVLNLGFETTGVLLLSGANTYSGPTSILRGTLRAGVASGPGPSGAFGSKSAVSLDQSPNAVLDLNNFDTVIGSLSGGGSVLLGSGRLFVGTDNSDPAPFSGIISGSGGLSKTGAGTQTISSTANPATGGISVDAGVLKFTGATSFDNGTFATAQTYTVTAGGTLEIQGDWLTKADSVYNINGGILAFTKTTGDTTINYVNNLHLANGTVAGPASFRSGNNTTTTHTFAGDSGNLIASGFGLVKNGPDQTVNLDVADGAADADLTVSGVIFDVANFAGATLNKQGAGKLVLTGNGTYTGPTTVSAGILQVGDGGTSGLPGTGTVTIGSSFVIKRSDTFTLANALLGTGDLVQAGPGTAILTGTMGHTGATLVNGGTLAVNTTLTSSPVTVNAGTLTGTGLVGSATVKAGGNIRSDRKASTNFLLDTLNLEAGSSVTVYPDTTIIDTLDLNVNGPANINIAGGGLTNGTYTLLEYVNLTGTAYTLGSLPPRVSATLSNNTGASALQLSVTNVDKPRWTGAVDGNWDTTTRNWKEIGSGNDTAYLQGDDVLFDDAATGTTDVVLDLDLAPYAVTFANATKPYSISGSGSIGGENGITKTGAGEVTLATENSFAGPVAINGGSIVVLGIEDSGVPSPLGAGDSIAFDGGTLSFIGGGGTTNRAVSLNPGGGTISCGNLLAWTGTLAGDGTLAKAGPGNLMLTSSNTYTGGTTIVAGRLTGNTNSSFGSGPITIGTSDEPAELYLGNRADIANAITVSAAGTGTVVLGADNTGSGANAAMFQGTVTLNRPTTFSGEVSADRLAFEGQITGNVGTLTVTGGSRVTFLSTASDFTGNLAITGDGTILQAAVATPGEVIPDACNVTVEGGAFLQLAVTGNGTESIGALNGNGTVRTYPTASYPGVLAVGTSNADGTFTGNLVNGTGALSLTKNGTGTQVCSGLNTYSGPTTVNGGTFIGTGSGNSNFTVKDTAALSPGSGPATVGTMQTRLLTLEAGSTLKMEIDSSFGAADRIDAAGNVTLTGATLALAEVGFGTLAPGTKLVLVNYLGYVVTGTFNGLAEGSQVTVGANNFTISYNDSSQVTLTVTQGGSYSAWAAANAPGQTTDQDHDGDGVANGVEYFMGESGASFTHSPTVGPDRKISWPKGASYAGVYGTDYVIQKSLDLKAWEDVPLGEVSIGTTLDYTLPAGQPKLFTRLKVTGP